MVARLVQEGCCEEKKRSRPGGPREGRSRRDRCCRQTVSAPAHDDDLVRRLRVSCDRLDAVGRPPAPGLTPPPHHRTCWPRSPVSGSSWCTGREFGRPRWAPASGGFRARRPGPVSGPRGRECRCSADLEGSRDRARLPRRRSRPPVASQQRQPRALGSAGRRTGWRGVQRVPEPPLGRRRTAVCQHRHGRHPRTMYTPGGRRP